MLTITKSIVYIWLRSVLQILTFWYINNIVVHNLRDRPFLW